MTLKNVYFQKKIFWCHKSEKNVVDFGMVWTCFLWRMRQVLYELHYWGFTFTLTYFTPTIVYNRVTCHHYFIIIFIIIHYNILSFNHVHIPYFKCILVSLYCPYMFCMYECFLCMWFVHGYQGSGQPFGNGQLAERKVLRKLWNICDYL